jgi:hypothetical protein
MLAANLVRLAFGIEEIALNYWVPVRLENVVLAFGQTTK